MEKKPMCLQHDNATPHTDVATSAAIESITFQVAPHTPYSLDLAPSDFWLFAALTEHLKGIHVTCDKDIQATIRKWFRPQPDKVYRNRSKKLVQC
jgi:hypothetical protein